MHSPATIGRAKGRLSVPDVGPRFGSTKRAAGSTKRVAGAPYIRAFCECVGVCAIRAAMALAVISALLLIAARPAQAQTETVLYNFAGNPDGAFPSSNLTSDGAGNFYGTTYGGGLGRGTVFELSPNGSGGWNETLLYSFCAAPICADGSHPMYADVILDSAGNLYGTTEAGGAYGWGVVFELSPVGTTWTETVLYSFANNGDGANPSSGLTMDPAGNLYGTTTPNGECSEPGTVFELSPSAGDWTEQVIYSAVTCTAGLTMDAAGNIFGVSVSTVFELSPNGNGGWNPTVIYAFKNVVFPGTPVLDKAGDLYGTTEGKWPQGNGTVYKLTLGKKGNWTVKFLHSFKGGKKDGNHPVAGLVFDAAGNIYGATATGGTYDVGTVFELVPSVGTGSYNEKILWSFNVTDGCEPSGSLILDSAGNLYSATVLGGPSNAGVAFEVTP